MPGSRGSRPTPGPGDQDAASTAAAQDQRRGGADRDRLHLAGAHRLQRAVQPAAIGGVGGGLRRSRARPAPRSGERSRSGVATAGAMRASPFSASWCTDGQGRVQAEGVVELQRAAGLVEAGDGDRAAQRRVVGIADRRRDGEPVHAAAADHHDQLAVLQRAVGGGEGLAAEELDRDAEPQRAGERLAARGDGEGGASLIGVGTPGTSAGWPGPPRGSRPAEMALATRGVSRAPSASAASWPGRARSGPAAARFSDQAMRLITASGAHQTSASSGQPLGEGALNGFWPMRVQDRADLRQASGRDAGGAPGRDHELVGGLELLRPAATRPPGASTSVLATSARSPPVPR